MNTPKRIAQYNRDPLGTTPELTITYRSIADLKPFARNARTHTRSQIRQIAESIHEFGWTNPVLIDAEGGIIAGHGRVEAAKLLGMDSVQVLLIDRLTDEQKRAYVLADNRLAELASWDVEILATELQHLAAVDLDFDIEITGFETAEIDLLVASAEAPDGNDPDDRLPESDRTKPPVSRLGDLWFLGAHRLLCGNALEAESFEQLMDGKRAQMIFTDPPYNVPIEGHVCGLGQVRHAEFAMAAGEMSEHQFTTFLETVFRHLVAHSADGSIHFVCMDWRHLYELMTAGRGVYAELKNLCVWNKTNGGMGSLYRSKHELVLVFKNGTAPHINNVELGKHGRNRTNVWDYPGVNSLGVGRLDELRMHPTVKPVAMVADAIRDCSKRRGIVLDSFAGSGTTLIAAERTGRIGYGIELDPKYVDVAIDRFRRVTGQEAVHAGTGLTFDQMKQARAAETDEESVGAIDNREATDAR